MEKALVQLKIHPHRVAEQIQSQDDDKNKEVFKPWVCSGQKLNPNQCKNSSSFDFKITNPQVTKYICEQKCPNFMICGSCVNEMQEVAMLPEQIDHPLHTKHTLYRSYNQEDWICDAKDYLGCLSNMSAQIDSKGIERYNCSKCDFDLCSKCIFFYLENPQMTYLYNVNSNIHEHVMTRWFDDNGWCCDGSKKNKGGCLSGVTGFGQTTNFNRWRCVKCDFDLCEKCLFATLVDACPSQTPPSKQQYQSLLESIQKNNSK
ncbi:hypothetical protein ABPG74_014566 [Tetrahymena malaccensis]